MKGDVRPADATPAVPADARDSVPRPSALLSVVRGEPTPEQLAAVVAVVAARAAATEDSGPAPRPLWSRPQLRAPLHPGADAWRASALPSP